jgi:hypothetical protein
MHASILFLAKIISCDGGEARQVIVSVFTFDRHVGHLNVIIVFRNKHFAQYKL